LLKGFKAYFWKRAQDQNAKKGLKADWEKTSKAIVKMFKV
jgi:hypothetical protein